MIVETSDEAITRFETSGDGLSCEQAQERLERYGPNLLPSRKPASLWKILAAQFASPLILILALAAMASMMIGDIKDAAFIGVVLLLNAVIGGYQEWKADRSTGALQSLLKIRSTVLREGSTNEVDAEELVPGDIVLLESGNRVPADLRLITSKGLLIDESFLTGESMAVLKDATHLPPDGESTSLGDRLELAFAGSVVTRGRSRGVVIATGLDTVVGRLAKELSGTSGGLPPLVVRMEKFSRAVGFFIVLAALGIGTLGVVVQGFSVTEMFFLGVALAVSAIPEGLPVAMTVALSVATRRMASRGVIVRQLSAVEGLGSCTLIASDKTGTLTCNELMVKEIRLPGNRTLNVTGTGYELTGQVTEQGEVASLDESLLEILKAGVLCNEARLKQKGSASSVQGDATDIALLALGAKMGVHRETVLAACPIWREVPFEPELRYAATFHECEGQRKVFVKGAPETVAAFCKEAVDMTVVERMAAHGLRTLALAGGVAEGEEIKDLNFLGFVGMIDPLRRGVKESIQSCHKAGLKVAMITGDHPITALAIGRELGLAESMEQVVTGPELTSLAPERLPDMVQKVRIFARIDPQQKLALVQAAQQSGELVAVTGDGVNDAAALRAANIGVAMGRSGTDVARDAADLVIADDNFATIVAGIEEGRVAYANVRKVIYLLVSTGAAEILMIALSVAASLPIPLLPVQLLWLNLATNGIQDVALAFEPQEGDPLEHEPRPPKERIFNRLMIERTLIGGLVIGLASFAVFRHLIQTGVPVEEARNLVLLLMVFFEIVHIGNCRSESVSAFLLSPLRNPILLGGSLLALALHFAAMYTPLGQSLLSAAPVSLKDMIWLGGISLSVLVFMEIHKFFVRARIKRADEQRR